MLPDLKSQAESFAHKIEAILNGTVTSEAKIVVTENFANHEVLDIVPEGSKVGKFALIPITSFLAAGEEPWLWLRVWFQVKLIGPKGHFGIESSSFGFTVSKESSRPIVRIEFDRDKGFEPDHDGVGLHVRNAAHVQIHGESNDLGYVKGRLGLNPKKTLADIHFPVGGRRFRPTLEDFIEFLHAEQLIPELKPDAREVLNSNREEWLKIQLKAAIENDIDTSLEALKNLGYKIISSDG
jgi:hypothetical protein